MGSSSSSTVTNNIKNYTINKNDLEALNSSVNNFVSNAVISNTSNCSTGTTQLATNNIGDLTVVGKKNKQNISISTEQNSQVSLQCIQQSIQQTNIANAMAQSVMNNLTSTVNNDALTSMVNSAEASMKQGVGGGLFNPGASVNSDINLKIDNLQKNETTRKLSNFISNSVSNNLDVNSVKDCFNKTVQNDVKNIGNISNVGEENEQNIKLSTTQYATSMATCQQLTQQTSGITSEMAVSLGLTIKDETANKQSSSGQNSASSSLKQSGLDDLVSAVFTGIAAFFSGPLIIGIVVVVLIIACCFVSIKLYTDSSSGSGENPDQSQNSNEAEGDGAGAGDGA